MCKIVGKVNKHVMLDELGRECYMHPRSGKWLPGENTKRGFVWLYDRHDRFSADRRPYEMPDGSTKCVRVTRYTYGFFTKPAAVPLGKNGKPYRRASLQCARSVYFDGERLWRAKSVPVGDRWIDTIVPLTGHVWDCHEIHSERRNIPVVEMDVEDGYPTVIRMDGEDIPLDKETWVGMVVPTLEIKA